MAVHAELQGRGIGTALVEYAEALARELGHRRMVLHARETALPFYEKLGYARIGEMVVKVTIPHWEMAKELTEVTTAHPTVLKPQMPAAQCPPGETRASP